MMMEKRAPKAAALVYWDVAVVLGGARSDAEEQTDRSIGSRIDSIHRDDIISFVLLSP